MTDKVPVKPRNGLLILGFYAVFGASSVQARQELVPSSEYNSARGAALGDAMLPLSNDGASALFVNPAGNASARDWHLVPINVMAAANQDFMSGSGLSFFDVWSLSKYRSRLEVGKNSGVGASFAPSFSFRGFSAGLLMQEEFLATLNASDQIEYRTKYQFIPALGFGIPLARGIVRIGYSLLWINEASGRATVERDAEPISYTRELNHGNGFSHNMGLMLTFPVTVHPTLSFVARNIGGITFRDSTAVPLAVEPVGVIERRQMSLDASVSIHPKTGKGGMMNMVVQGKDMLNSAGADPLSRISLGWEYEFRSVLSLRLGWGSRYPSAGFGIGGKRSSFDAAWYSEEIGTLDTRVRDTRFLLQYQIRAF